MNKNKKFLIAVSALVILPFAVAGGAYLFIELKEGIFGCGGASRQNATAPNRVAPEQGQSAGQGQIQTGTEHDQIKVGFPIPGQRVGNQIVVSGIAKGGWYFEGDFPVLLEDEQGNVLASSSARAQGSWMNEDFVPFVSVLDYPREDSREAVIILQKDNPSDIRELDDQIEIPVVLGPDDSSAQVFLSSQHFDRNVSSCGQVFSIGRPVSPTMAAPRQSLEELLNGPTVSERELGYGTAIPGGVQIQNFDASEKIAKVDLSKELLDLEVDTACSRSLIQNQISETIKNASGVEQVVITVDGQPFPGEFLNGGPSGKSVNLEEK